MQHVLSENNFWELVLVASQGLFQKVKKIFVTKSLARKNGRTIRKKTFEGKALL
jgi:hypothetical protein